MKYYNFGGATVLNGEGDCFLLEWPVSVWNGVSFTDSKPISGWDNSLIATYPVGEFVHVDCIAGFFPVYSERFRQFLESRLPGAMQFLAMRIQHHDGTDEVLDYFLGQVLLKVDCIDKERTSVEDDKWSKTRDGWYRIKHRVILKRALIGDHQLFRVDGYPILLIVREDLKNAIEKEGFTGCAFNECKVTL